MFCFGKFQLLTIKHLNKASKSQFFKMAGFCTETLQLLCVLWLCVCVSGDLYLHIPRGSNNRLNEKTATRATNDRLFDSQVSFSVMYLGLCLGQITRIAQKSTSHLSRAKSQVR